MHCRTVSPGIKSIAYSQLFIVSIIKIQHGKIRFRGGIRERVNVKFEIQRVVGQIVTLHRAAQQIRAGTVVPDGGCSEVAPQNNRAGFGHEAHCQHNQTEAKTFCDAFPAIWSQAKAKARSQMKNGKMEKHFSG